MYELEFLPIAKQDMVEIARYISKELCNPSVAEKLANEMIEAAEGLTTFPYINAVHITSKPLKREYRRLTIKNYSMFYWVNEVKRKIVIARVMYARRDFDNLLI